MSVAKWAIAGDPVSDDAERKDCFPRYCGKERERRVRDNEGRWKGRWPEGSADDGVSGVEQEQESSSRPTARHSVGVHSAGEFRIDRRRRCLLSQYVQYSNSVCVCVCDRCTRAAAHAACTKR